MNYNYTIDDNKMKKRHLSRKEIDYILNNFDHFFPQYLDKDIKSKSIYRFKNKIAHELKNLLVYDNCLEEIKQQIETYLMRSIVPSGESVGIVTAQSLGEKQTQLTLNSFHQAGLSLATVVTGVPRFLEILNTSKDPKNAQNSFFLKEKQKSLPECKTIISNKLKCLKFQDLIKKRSIHTKPSNHFWFEPFFYFFPSKHNFKNTLTVSFQLEKEILFRNEVCLLTLKKQLEAEFDDIIVVFSPLYIAQIDILLDYDQILESIDNKDDYFNSHLSCFLELFYDEVLCSKIEQVTIHGVAKIKDYFITRNIDTKDEKNPFLISTEGSNLKDLLQLDFIDKKTLQSNDIWDIYNLIGIEGTRKFLIQELNEIVSSDGFVNKCHIELLVDTMTNTGNITSISRYGIKKDKNSVFSRSSFEESLDHFVKAGFFSEHEMVTSVSASIMTGKHCNIGTGLPKIIPNWSNLLTNSE